MASLSDLLRRTARNGYSQVRTDSYQQDLVFINSFDRRRDWATRPFGEFSAGPLLVVPGLVLDQGALSRGHIMELVK